VTRVALPLATIGLLGVLAGLARAHTVPPEAILARLNTPETRAATGVEGATRDPQVPRLLVVRVGAGWYRRAASVREAEAGAWLELWRKSVEQGIVAVLDARTDAPVVRFRRGAVVGIASGFRADAFAGEPAGGSARR
jgi:hypothetical protein